MYKVWDFVSREADSKLLLLNIIYGYSLLFTVLFFKSSEIHRIGFLKFAPQSNSSEGNKTNTDITAARFHAHSVGLPAECSICRRN